MLGLARCGLVASFVASFVASSLAGCGPASEAPLCSDSSKPEVTYPEGLDEDLITAATDHADERLTRFASPLDGYAYEGRFQTESEGVVHSSADALGLLAIEGQWVRLDLSDRTEAVHLALDYHPLTHADRVTPGDWGVVCPAELPVPVPSQPFRLPPTLCEAMERGTDIELSVDTQPVDPDDIDWDDLLFLNDLRVDGRTPSNFLFEPSGHGHSALDQASYLSIIDDDNRLYVDYEAHWFIDLDCPTSHVIVTLDILHAERCNTAGHTHGRYDSACVTIATVAGRPDWASGF